MSLAIAQEKPPTQDPTVGPFFADPNVMELLDRSDTSGSCAKSGHLVFGCLVQARAKPGSPEAISGSLSNPFNLKVMSAVVGTIQNDLTSLQEPNSIQLNPRFLTNEGSKLELVGVINRMDRRNGTKADGTTSDYSCGEVSLIYRFSYKININGVAAQSRLPVTMNVVFPANAAGKIAGQSNCATTAKTWLDQMATVPQFGGSVSSSFSALTNPTAGIVPLLNGRDIDRIELNMQVSRKPTSGDTSDFGSSAKYVIRVFRWNSDQQKFLPSFLANQIDRERLLGLPNAGNSCEKWSGTRIDRKSFLSWLGRAPTLFNIDAGRLDIPEPYLACRAISVSPGGPHRSANSPFWSSADDPNPLLSDNWIEMKLAAVNSPKTPLNFMKSADDFRMRLNEQSCTGCHQTRAIAGFHFPGADRSGTSSFNAVYLPGSAHFFGDQPRRSEILELYAIGKSPSLYELAASYASRPMNRYNNPARKFNLAGTQMIGGWGSMCIAPANLAGNQREWNCRANLRCAQLFESTNAPSLGVCAPPGPLNSTEETREIGDALQRGKVTSVSFGRDTYLRTVPTRVGNWADRETRNTLIPVQYLPQNPPAENSYFGAHQEWYPGRAPLPHDTAVQAASVVRDAKTGGFPSGMLRLSECLGLPNEATCGLVASSGFNACIAKMNRGEKSMEQCFTEYTSYAGLRACDPANPCRDDYICLKPIGYNEANGRALFLKRKQVTNYTPVDFGQREPELVWLKRNSGKGDQRGICIPPYFVFQFRSDLHPAPMKSDTRKTILDE